MWRNWRRLTRLPRPDIVILGLASIGFPLAAGALRLRGLTRVQALITRRWGTGAVALDQGSANQATHVAALVELAARHAPWRPNCLQRSVVLWALLRREGISSDLRLGVRKRPGMPMPDFHAWLELGDRVLNDRPDIRAQYAAFDGSIGADALSSFR